MLAIFGSSHLLTSIIPRKYVMQITSGGGVSSGSNTSANGAETSERLSSTIVFNSPNNFSTRPEEAVNLAFGVYIVGIIRFQNKRAPTFQTELIHSGEGLQLRINKIQIIL